MGCDKYGLPIERSGGKSGVCGPDGDVMDGPYVFHENSDFNPTEAEWMSVAIPVAFAVGMLIGLLIS